MLPERHEERMEEIRGVMAGYTLNNIYEENGSGLLYCMDPNRTYLGSNESRCNGRGISFRKYKENLTVVFCTNVIGSLILPIRYIGSAASPVCF